MDDGFRIRVGDGALCVVSPSDGSIRVWDPNSGQYLHALDAFSEVVCCLRVLPDGRVAIGSSDGALRVWDSLLGQNPQVLKGHGGSVNCIAILQDGCIVSCSDDNAIREWNLNTGECIKTIRITEVDVSHMDLSSAILTEDLAKMLWQNGAKISEADFEKYVRKH